MYDTEDVKTDDLFIALTRPPTIFGVPYGAAVLEAIVVLTVFLAIGNPLYLLLAVPVHGLLYAVGAADPRIFDALFLWLKTVGRCQNAGLWGAATFSPLSNERWRNE
jgi:type IV secretion system protein VirB3